MVALAALLVAAPRGAVAQSWPTVTVSAPLTGLVHPTHLASARDGSGRLFVTEEPGRVRIVQNGAIVATPFLDITDRVRAQGLLSIAFPPGYAQKGHFYLNYTTSDHFLRVSRFSLSSDPNVADPASEQIVFSAGPFGDHVGGELCFGPNGFLYFGIGTGTASAPDALGQDVTSVRAKLLRIDVETGNPATYSIPPGNPFVNTAGARPEIWALGVRNPFRTSFDRQSGDFYIADVGQSTREEIDFEPAGDAGGHNYGWNVMEGSLCFNAATCSTAGLTLPIIEYDHSVGCSITGGTVYRGSSQPALGGIYFYGDWCSGRIWGAQRVNGAWQSALLVDTAFAPIGFSEDEAGNLWVGDYNGGGLYQLSGSAPSATPTPTATPDPTPLAANLAVTQSAAPSPVPVGDRVTFSIQIKNNGNVSATSVALTDNMPPGVPFVAASSTQGTCTRAGDTLSCPVGTLTPGATATITLILQPSVVGNISNSASATASEPDGDPADNAATLGVAVVPKADASLSINDSPDPVRAGSPLTFTLTAKNLGPSSATGVVVSNTLPASMALVSATATQGSCSFANGVVTANIGTLAKSATATITIVVTPATAGTFSNTPTIAATETDPVAANNAATASTTVNPALAPTISKFSPASGPVGTLVTITGTNLNGASSLRFNGTAATFTINSATQIIAVVPQGATSGPISATTLGGTATSAASFVVTTAPLIYGFSPAGGSAGASVIVYGAGFNGATALKFGSSTASFTVDSAAQITATLPASALIGKISVTTPLGTATSAASFTPAPRVSNFAPLSGPIGSLVTLNGFNFTGTTLVKINGVAASFVLLTANRLVVCVPANATDGPFMVATVGGSGNSTANFDVTP